MFVRVIAKRREKDREILRATTRDFVQGEYDPSNYSNSLKLTLPLVTMFIADG